MHSYLCPNEKSKKRVCAQLGRCIPSMSISKEKEKKRKECVCPVGKCIQSCTSMSKEKRVCVPGLGSVYIAKEVTNVDRKYIVWCLVRYPTTNE